MKVSGRLLGSLRPLGMGLALAALGAAGCGNEPLDVAPNVDLGRFQGKWYEIARLPRSTQTDCFGTTAFYAPATDGSGGMQFVNQCNVGKVDGPLSTVTMAATVPDPKAPAKLAVDIAGYAGDYWILEVGPQYEYAVVGHPSRLYLWILSRTPTLDTATTGTLVAHAQSAHFDTTQLVYTPQPPAGERGSSTGPVGTVPPALSTGCSLAAPGRTSPGRRLGFVLLAAVAALGSCARSRRRVRRAGIRRPTRTPASCC